MTPPLFTKTTNFFRLYHHICGESECPKIYHFWCCVSLLSAALEDRCWIETIKNQPLTPNLYVCLVGPGGLGKGIAISQAVHLVRNSITLRTFRGRATHAKFIDVLCQGREGESDGLFDVAPKMWLIMDELKNDVGSNIRLNQDMIALMTELYTATNYIFEEGTRTHGHNVIENPNVNWLFGSTIVWLKQVLSKDIFESGFVARTCFIFADYDPKLRISRIKYPWDYDEVFEHLRARLYMIQAYRGPFKMLPEAEAALDSWYHGRRVPKDEILYSIWYRQKEMVLRFAMINCIADGGDMLIHRGHVIRGIQMAGQLFKFHCELLKSASETLSTAPVGKIEKFLQKVGEIDHSTLLRKMRSYRGYNAQVVNQAITDLMHEKKIKIDWVGPTKHKKYYTWIGDAFVSGDGS